MRKFSVVAMAIFVIMIFCSCNSSENEDFSSKYPELFESESKSQNENTEIGKGTLFIGGIETDIEVAIFDKTVQLPLLRVLEGLDANISWSDNETAEISYNNSSFTLSLSKLSIVKKGEETNLFPQSSSDEAYKCEAKDKEIILDQKTFFTTMKNLGTPINYSASYDSMTVSISLK